MAQLVQDADLIKKTRAAAGSDATLVRITHSNEETLDAIEVRRERECDILYESMEKLNLQSAYLYKCAGETPSERENFILSVSALRYGKKPSDCSVVISTETVDDLASRYSSTENSKRLYTYHIALHEGAHCTKENTRGELVTSNDILSMRKEEYERLSDYREAHADAYALLFLGRELAQNGQFSNFKDFLSDTSRGLSTPEAIAKDNPLTRASMFLAFSERRYKFDPAKFASLTDEDMHALAAKMADAGDHVTSYYGNDTYRRELLSVLTDVEDPSRWGWW